jgi:flavin-binding protein dodecin
MVQKVIDVVGISPRSFAAAAKDAVSVAAETVRGMRWARVSELELDLDGGKIRNYRVTARIYFDVKR